MLNSIPVKPINEKWTDDQWKAIYARGNDILVAAAAGSGKTAVLVERIIKRILDEKDPIEVDRLLVVTFTNAAAQEMRSRIGEAIEKELRKNPASLHLRKQLSILNSASISTIHSFCLEVIRNYYYEINIDPGFRIGNEAELQMLKDDVIEELLEFEYSNEANEDFFKLVDSYTSDSDDSTLRNLVLKLYTFAINTPNPKVYLEKVREAYNINKINSIDDLVITRRLKNSIAIELEGALTKLEGSEDCCNGVNGPVVYLSNLIDEISQVADVLEYANNSTWESIRTKVNAIEFKRLKPTKDVDEELLENAKAQRDSAKKIIAKIKEKYFQRSEASLLNDIKALYPLVCKLTNLVESFSEMFSKEKQSLGIVDFSDLEHYCLEILRNPDVSLYYKKKFSEIYVDEYQDTNFVQEEIIKSVVSDTKGNRFMVGDVKQSIYRFRLAEPNLFLEKYKRFTKDGTKTGIRIDLSKNFRSRSEVLDSTNFIFECIMDEAVGEIEYDKDARLYLGATNYPECDAMSTELLIINSSDDSTVESQTDDEEQTSTDEDTFEELERSQIEARVIAKKIIEMRKQKFLVYNGKTDQRLPLENKDIVILVRSMTWVPEMMEELNKQGIKVYAELSTGYFDAVEIGIFLSLLKVIDNPQQDIPLASVLRSPLVGLNEPSLAHIRSYERSDSFYEALKYYVNNPPENVNHEALVKVKRFTDNLSKWRTMARKTSLADFIWVLYRETGYFDFIAGLPAGKQRQANLRVLYERAKNFEKTAYQGLFRFLQYIDRMKKRGDDLGTARALSEQEDVVRIMTIHKSKGLEFPVVFISNLGKQFNMQDLNSSSLIDKELGIGLQHVRTDLSIKLDTLPLLAIKEKAKLEQLSEEMRVLYVALTRAKEKLIMVGTVKNKEKSIKDWNQTCDASGIIPRYSRIKAKSYIDWVGPAFGKLLNFAEDFGKYKDDKVNIKFNFIKKHDVHEVVAVKEVNDFGWMEFIENRDIIPNVDIDVEEISTRMNWIYPYENLTKVPANLTVTEIKRRSQQLEQEEGITKNTVPMPFLWDRPAFMKEKDVTSTERGTATHKIMQFISLTSNKSVADVERELESMIDKELITREDKEVIDTQKISNFFESSIAERLTKSSRRWRELPFNFAIPISEVYQHISSNEKVFVKGIIDCMFEEDGELVILDFKTDKIIGKYKDAETGKKKLVENYRKQLEVYKRAIEEITNKKVKECYLYLFDIDEEVKLH
ncbi:MAG: addA [Bacillales bacterium]|jgi:ATP-dependent helicase/nuclease subunit A|nr:addA [Bacillales bacterium]